MEVYALKLRPRKHPFPIFALLIMLVHRMNIFSDAAWSHNAVLFKALNGKWLVVDSTSKGVRIQSDESFFKRYKLIGSKILPAPRDQYALLRWLQDIVGREYDTKQVFGLALKCLRLKKFNATGNDYKKMVCCEVILNYLEVVCGYSFLDPDNFSLEETWDMIPDNN